MATRIGINGFGRIGRLSFRAISEKYAGGIGDIEVVAINDLTDAETNAFLLAHDSNYGALNEDITLILGVNNDAYDPARHRVISNASCTTNGLAPVAKVLNDNFGIEKGLLTAVHAYTNSQATADTAAKDLRDARAAAQNTVPSPTGAAKAVGLVLPDLHGKFTGMSFRVPVPTVSAVDFTALLRRAATIAEINAAHRAAAESGPLAGILQYTEEPLVSSDLKGNSHSSIFSAVDTIGLGSFVKVVSWYDNEWEYASRIADLVKFLSDRGL